MKYLLVFLLISLPVSASAETTHGPGNSDFLSHEFQWNAHRYEPQLNLHFGLSQPILFQGFNLAVDFRIGRWVFEYSHGAFLNYSALPSIAEQFVGNSGAKLESPWTTGTGVGFNLVDDLYAMVELKAHRYNTALDDQTVSYTTISIGPTLAYRLFLWRGMNITTYLRYWPNVWDSTKEGKFQISDTVLEPVDLGLFVNLSVGWAFNL